ncbi:hypothetical protein RRG08_053352 [Elysia crispata]|uniref:Uncharacterized protein n=1 Tax=Elysia crispata TaxID=231223 RepID=A0AAE0ZLY7_9GAST|nr:hypothetical protein RRG08_053352 [Elysia crispata]
MVTRPSGRTISSCPLNLDTGGHMSTYCHDVGLTPGRHYVTKIINSMSQITRSSDHPLRHPPRTQLMSYFSWGATLI